MSKVEDLYNEMTTNYDERFTFDGVDGKRIAKRLSELSSMGATELNGVNRPGFSSEEKQAKELVKTWMEEAGLHVREDGAGNVFGVCKGTEEGKAIMSGSHLDSVPNGGNYDGPLGVIAALEIAQAWKDSGDQPAKPYEVVVFSDEEGSRFGTGMTGSRAMVGDLKEEKTAQLSDGNGHSFDSVLRDYGSSADEAIQSTRDMNELELFVELHIEQGKILESNGLSVGVVKGIAGPVWLDFVFEGEAGHAGNTPMNGRRDPVVAAGEFAYRIASLPGQYSDTAVATIGRMNVSPNGMNVIAQTVELTVDVRDIHKESRDALIEAIIKTATTAAESHNINMNYREMLNVDPLLINESLMDELKETVEEFGITPMELMSGAGHDAMIVGEKIPVAMLFVKSKDGISHNPKEWTDLNDSVQAIHVLKKFIEKQMSK